MKKILVLGHNSQSGCQMAAGYLHFFAGRIAAVYHVRPQPADTQPSLVQVMLEDNIDIAEYPPQSLSQLSDQHFDYIITVGHEGNARLPRRPRTQQHFHWSLAALPHSVYSADDPLDFLRQKREIIKKQVLKFVGQELLEPAILRG